MNDVNTKTKFKNTKITAKGEERAWVSLNSLDSLWFNTGTLCNLACDNCYIESSPTNDRLEYITFAEVKGYLDEIRDDKLTTREIGITGGEPFMNPYIISILTLCLDRGFDVQLLTNATQPMQKNLRAFKSLNDAYGSKLNVRVSIDHFNQELHEKERGAGSWKPMIKGLKWLVENNFNISLAGRTLFDDEPTLRAGYAELITEHQLNLDANNPAEVVIFPEMDEKKDVPEITTKCWDILNKSPDDIMCANSRMVVKHKGETTPKVMACTLISYDDKFKLGTTLKEASKDIYLNHPHCSTFCVLGGASCSVQGK